MRNKKIGLFLLFSSVGSGRVCWSLVWDSEIVGTMCGILSNGSTGYAIYCMKWKYCFSHLVLFQIKGGSDYFSQLTSSGLHVLLFAKRVITIGRRGSVSLKKMPLLGHLEEFCTESGNISTYLDRLEQFFLSQTILEMKAK